MKKTKIDWCDCTINPVVGCKNGCKYCYAERINDRFHFVPNWKKPEFFPKKLEQLKSKKPKSIFMDSMSDIGRWEEPWREQVYKAIEDNPQHNYIFLTKGKGFLDALYKWKRNIGNKQTIFFGKTVDKQDMTGDNDPYDFLSVEPILEPIELKGEYNRYLKLVIIGAETGNRKGKVIPKKEWIDDIVTACDEANVGVFMKESLRKIMGDEFRQDKLPWDIE